MVSFKIPKKQNLRNKILYFSDCDVIDLVSKEMLGNSKCINYACKSGKSMISAPEFCLSYYRVKKKLKKSCVCMECYNNAMKFYDNMAHCLIKGEKLIDVDIPFRDDLVEIDDSDEEQFVNEEEVLPAADIKFVNDNIDDIVQKMVTDYNVKEQVQALDVKLKVDVDSFQGK